MVYRQVGTGRVLYRVLAQNPTDTRLLVLPGPNRWYTGVICVRWALRPSLGPPHTQLLALTRGPQYGEIQVEYPKVSQ